MYKQHTRINRLVNFIKIIQQELSMTWFHEPLTVPLEVIDTTDGMDLRYLLW